MAVIDRSNTVVFQPIDLENPCIQANLTKNELRKILLIYAVKIYVHGMDNMGYVYLANMSSLWD